MIKMRQKKYPRILLTIFLIMMLTLVIPMQHAGASGLTHRFGFEGFAAGSQYYDTRIRTHLNQGFAEVSTSYVRSGTRSYAMGNDTLGISYAQWNISGGDFLTNFSYYMRLAPSSGGNSVYIALVNRTIAVRESFNFKAIPDYSKGPLAILRYSHDGKSYYRDNVGAEQYMGVNRWYYTCPFYSKEYIAFTNDIGDMRYASNLTYAYNMYACNATAVNEGYIVDIIYFHITTGYVRTYFDDCNITLSSSYTGDDVPQVGCIDTTGLTQVGYFGSTQRDSPAQYISKTYGVSVTTTIEGVELQVSRDQILQAGDMGNYELKINGMSLGMPTCSVLLEAYGILQWVTDMTITNNVVNFEFYHSKKTLNWYWQVGVGATSSTDLDGDGDIWYRQSRAETTYEWRWFWIFPYQAPIYDEHAEEIPYDMAVKWWCTGFDPPSGIEYDYNDDIGLSKYVYYNNATETYIYNLSRKNHDTIFGGYTLNDPIATYCVHLYTISCDFNTSNASEIRTTHWPHACNYPGSTFGYAPLTSACYIVQLHKDGALEKQLNISVEGTIGDYSIRTSPPITNQYETYEVLWRYYQAQGYTGRIGMMSIHKDALKLYTNTEVTIPPINPNTTGTYTHYSTSSTAEYWGLYVYANNQYVLYAETTHIIRVPSIYENTIRPLLESVELYGSNQLLGQHIFPGGDVRVYVNDRLIQNVGDSQSFVVTYETTQPGVHVAQLRVYLDNGTQVLAQCTFVVKTDVRPPTADTRDWDWLNLIPTLYIPLIGIGIIAMFALLPLIVVTSLQKKVNIQIHMPEKVMMIISMFTGFAGYILTILWGILEWWTIFMVLFSFILILAILYYSGHKDGGGTQ